MSSGRLPVPAEALHHAVRSMTVRHCGLADDAGRLRSYQDMRYGYWYGAEYGGGR